MIWEHPLLAVEHLPVSPGAVPRVEVLGFVHVTIRPEERVHEPVGGQAISSLEGVQDGPKLVSDVVSLPDQDPVRLRHPLMILRR